MLVLCELRYFVRLRLENIHVLIYENVHMYLFDFTMQGDEEIQSVRLNKELEENIAKLKTQEEDLAKQEEVTVLLLLLLLVLLGFL